jgi:hypothetical protein
MTTHPNIVAFMALAGRPPCLGDAVPPWRYRGWLAYYVQAMHAAPNVAFPDRWGYLQQVHAVWGRPETADLDPGPIPRVDFGRRSEAVFKGLTKAVELAGATRYGGWGWSSFRVFIDFLAWGLAVSNEPPELDDATCEKLYRSLDMTGWLEHPRDYLAEYICEMRGNGWNPTAFDPTPHEVCEAMVSMQMHDGAEDGDNRRKTVCDPACGTGRMLLHASNHSLYLFGQDIDGLVVRCTYINGALYAPWIVAPPPRLASSVPLLPLPPTFPPSRA